MDHRQYTLAHIAKVVGQFTVHPADHGAMAKITIIAKRDFAQQEITGLIKAIAFRQIIRINDVAD